MRKSITYQVASIMGKLGKVLVVLSIPILLNIYYILPAQAVDSTPSADLKAKLELLKAEIASRAAQLKKEINQKLQNKAYVGTIKTKTVNTANSSGSLTLAAKTGPKIVTLNQDTVFDTFGKSKTRYSLKAVAEEDYIAALGDIDDNGVLTAKKLILLPTPTDQPKTNLWGQITSISDNLISIKTREGKSISISVNKDTQFAKTDGQSSLGELRTNDFIIVTGRTNKNDIFEADFIYTVPTGAVLKIKKVATPSAQVATPSGKVKATPSPTPKSKK